MTDGCLAAGQALFFLKLFKTLHRYEFFKAKQYITNAHQYINAAVALVPQGNLSSVGFLRGSSGVYGIASIIYSIVSDYTSAQNVIVKVKKNEKRRRRRRRRREREKGGGGGIEF